MHSGLNIAAKDYESPYFEIGVGDILYAAYHRNLYYIFGDPSYINPPTLEHRKVIIGIPGAGGDSSSFHPLFKKVHEAGLQCGLYTVEYKQTDEQQLPLGPLVDKLDQIERFGQNIDVTLVGHSAGALIATKMIWQTGGDHKISHVFSLAGRQTDSENNRFPQFSADVLPEAERAYKVMQSNPEKVSLHCYHGSADGIVPEESALVKEAAEKVSVEGVGHLGILYSERFETDFVQKMKVWVKC